MKSNILRPLRSLLCWGRLCNRGILTSRLSKSAGAQYGRAYLEPYNIKMMFDRGARISSGKMNPCAMLEELQSLHPGRYTLPGENEIRAEIIKLFGRKKANDEDNAGSDHDKN